MTIITTVVCTLFGVITVLVLLKLFGNWLDRNIDAVGAVALILFAGTAAEADDPALRAKAAYAYTPHKLAAREAGLATAEPKPDAGKSPKDAETILTFDTADAGATLSVDGVDFGTLRRLSVPPLPLGMRHVYRVLLTYSDGEHQEWRVKFIAGEHSSVELKRSIRSRPQVHYYAPQFFQSGVSSSC